MLETGPGERPEAWCPATGATQFAHCRIACGVDHDAPLPSPGTRSGLDRSQRAVTTAGHLDARAGATLDELPRITLEVHRGRALAGGAGAGSAVVLAFQCNAVALFLVRGNGGAGFGLRKRRGMSDRCEQARDDAGEQG